MKNLIIIPILAISVLAGCQSSKKQDVRYPTSASDGGEAQPLPIEFTPNEITMLRQMLRADIDPGSEKLNVSTEFSSDNRNKDFLERTKKAMKAALGNTFQLMPNEKGKQDTPLPEKLKKNVIKAFLKEFVLTLEAYKLVDGKVRIHVYMFKDKADPESYFDELNNNKLIDLSHRENFLQPNPSPIDKAIEMAKNDNSALIYLGGAIELEIEFLNIGLDTSAVNGKIKYKRFYQQKDKTMPFVINSDGVSYKTAYFPGDAYITVEVAKAFNLKNMKPELDHMNIYFGEINDRFHGRKSEPLRLKNEKGESKIKLSSLHYDFSSKKFDNKRSEAKDVSKALIKLPMTKKVSAKMGRILEKHREKVTRYLKLERFWDAL